jgi:hypothetical protein
MSRPFAAVESFLERILERPAARLFHAHPQPVQLERRIERAMTSQRMVRGGHTYVPSRYRIILNPSDLVALQEASDHLPSDLADAILQRARSQGYWLVARPEVLLVPSARIMQGDLEVDAEALDPSLVSSAAAGLRPVGLEGPRPPRPPIPGTGVVPDPAPALVPLPDLPVPVAPSAPTPMAPQEATPPPPDGFDRAVAAAAASALVEVTVDGAPEVASPTEGPVQEPMVRAIIEVRRPDQAPETIGFEGGTIRVGRGTDNEIVVLDERVSRHHGRFTARHGVLVYTDLDSTNGSLVNGTRVREAGLGAGDVVRLGRTTLSIRDQS